MRDLDAKAMKKAEVALQHLSEVLDTIDYVSRNCIRAAGQKTVNELAAVAKTYLADIAAGQAAVEADAIVQKCADIAREIIVSEARYKPRKGERKRTSDELSSYVYNSLTRMKSRHNVLLTAKEGRS